MIYTYYMYKMAQNINKQFTITKKIAKHGKQAIIVVPKILEQDLKPGTIAKVTIDVLNSSEVRK